MLTNEEQEAVRDAVDVLTVTLRGKNWREVLHAKKKEVA